MSRSDFSKAKRVVIKIGSSLLTSGGLGLDKPAIAAWVEQMAKVSLQDKDVVLVSSGSVAEGISRLGLKKTTQHTPRTSSGCLGWTNGLSQNL